MALFAVQYRAIIAAEEEFLRSRFGAEYDAWCARVPRFWPRLPVAPTMADLSPLPPRRPFDWRRALRKEHNPAAAWIALAMVLVAADRVKLQAGGLQAEWPH